MYDPQTEIAYLLAYFITLGINPSLHPSLVQKKGLQLCVEENEVDQTTT